MLGDWDTAEQELTQAADSDGLADHEFLACHRGWLAALRGDAATAETMLAALQDLRASEDPQDKALVSTVEAFTAATRGQPQDALRHARAALDHADALGISHDLCAGPGRWPPAPPMSCDDTGAAGELLALLDAYQPGRPGPDAAGRTRPGPCPPGRPRRRPGRCRMPSRPPSPACAN